MTDLLFAIPTIIPQPSPSMSLVASYALYVKFYATIEAYDPLSEAHGEEPTLVEMQDASDYLVDCFAFGRKKMVGDYIRDLFMYRLVFVVGVQLVSGSTGGTTENKYQDILDEIKSRWVNYTFADVNAVMTFAMIEAMA